MSMKKREAYWTYCDSGDGDRSYYFAPTDRQPPPYGEQREVRAVIDIAPDGTLAGIELIDDMPPAPGVTASVKSTN